MALVLLSLFLVGLLAPTALPIVWGKSQDKVVALSCGVSILLTDLSESMPTCPWPMPGRHPQPCAYRVDEDPRPDDPEVEAEVAPDVGRLPTSVCLQMCRRTRSSSSNAFPGLLIYPLCTLLI